MSYLNKVPDSIAPLRKDLLSKREVTGPMMDFVLRNHKNPDFLEELRSAAEEAKIMRIPVTLSHHQDQVAKLEEFLRVFFPVKYEHETRWPLVVVTVFSARRQGSYLERESHLKKAHESILHTANKLGLALRLNVHIAAGSTIEWNRFLEHVEGVDIAMVKCKVLLDNSIKSSARTLTLRFKQRDYQNANGLGNIAAHFPHVHDLRIIVEHDNKKFPLTSLRSDLEHFKELISFSLQINSVGDLDLTGLHNLHTLRISSDSRGEDLKLPKNIQSFALKALGYRLEMSKDLLHQLHSLSHLQSVELENFDLQEIENSLTHHWTSLVRFDVRDCILPESIGTPRQHLRKLHLRKSECADEGYTIDLQAFKELTAISCTWAVFQTTHAPHLKILWIDTDIKSKHVVDSLEQFKSLTELWLPVPLLKERAIKQAREKHNILKVFPVALEILVLHDPGQQVLRGLSWDFSPLKHLRSLAAYSNNPVDEALQWDVNHTKFPPFLHTIAVPKDLVGHLREHLRREKAPIRVTIMHDDMWNRGPSNGGFLSWHSEGDPSEQLESLQERQRDQDARHHHSGAPGDHTSSVVHASTSD